MPTPKAPFLWGGPPPFEHQRLDLARTFEERAWAYLWETGTGKTKIALTLAANLYDRGKIDRVLLVAPNGVHRNWIEQGIAEHWPGAVPVVSFAYDSGRAHGKRYLEELRALSAPASLSTKAPTLRFLSVNIEALRSKHCKDLVRTYLANADIARGSLFILDESTDIKSAISSQRRAVDSLGKLALYRRILTGSEVAETPLDLYTQFQFLKPGCLGHDTFTTFKAYYAEWRTKVIQVSLDKKREYPELIRFRNQEELRDRMSRISSRMLKRNLDLPPKLYRVRSVVMRGEQLDAYAEVKARVLAELAPGELTTEHVLTKLLRLQQIAGGFVKLDDGREYAFPQNAKMEALLEEIELVPRDRQIIVWSRFVPELRELQRLLSPLYGPIARYWGEISDDDRQAEANEFIAGKRRIMAAQQRAGGKGHTWIGGTHVLYYSNTFSYLDRFQSEDRAHRIGQTEAVTYTDLPVDNSVDGKILRALKAKADVAEFFKSTPITEIL